MLQKNMSISERLKQGFRISVELVPSMIEFRESEDTSKSAHPSLNETLSVLRDLGVSFISVTQGAGKNSREHSLPLLKSLHAHEMKSAAPHFERCAHLICGFADRDEVFAEADALYAEGIRNFLVLRGDPPNNHGAGVDATVTQPLTESQKQNATSNEFHFAYQAVRELRTRYPDICIGVGAYPDSQDRRERIGYLLAKQEAGAEFAITQMIFSAPNFRAFSDEARAAGVKIPILPGTCFIHSNEHAQTFAKRFGVRAPDNFTNPLEFMSNLIEDFREAGAPGVHLFVLDDLGLTRQLVG